MTQEIQWTVGGTVKNPSAGTGYVDTLQSQTFKFTQSVAGAETGIFAVPTTANGTLLPVTLLTTQGWAFLQNLDATNYVQLGVRVAGTFYPFARLLAGEFALVRLDSGAVVYALANTATCNVMQKVYNN